MRVILCLLVCGLAAPAGAADFVWAVGPASATRWMEQGTPESGAVAADQKLEVLFREAGRVRVRLTGGKFGWLDEAAVTAVAPAGAGAAATPSFDLSKLNLGGGGGGGLKIDGDGNLVLQ